MEDIIAKIKETEKEAALLIKKSDEEAEKIIDEARKKYSYDLENKKQMIALELKKYKEEMLLKIKDEKLNKEKTHFTDFTKNLGDLAGKKQNAIDYLFNEIKDYLEK